MNLDLSKASSSDCIPVVVLENCVPELSSILAELFNKCLKESCFSRLLEGPWWSLYLEMLEKGLQLRTTIEQGDFGQILQVRSSYLKKIVTPKLNTHQSNVNILVL